MVSREWGMGRASPKSTVQGREAVKRDGKPVESRESAVGEERDKTGLGIEGLRIEEVCVKD
jgi:hypothetical protein